MQLPDVLTCTYSAPTAIDHSSNVFIDTLDPLGLRVKFTYPAVCPPASPTPTTGSVWLHPNLLPSLGSFVKNLNYFSREFGGYGPLRTIGHAGARRYQLKFSNGQISPSYHYEGNAFDIRWLLWEDGNSAILSQPCQANNEAGDPTKRRRLIAVEACLRKWFGYVLNRGISMHADHFHVDNGCHVALRLLNDDDSVSGSRSAAACVHQVVPLLRTGLH